jgi:hypothetical protein
MKLGAITPFQLKKGRFTGVDQQSAFCCRWVKYPQKHDAIRFRYENLAGLARLSTSTERCLCSSVIGVTQSPSTADGIDALSGIPYLWLALLVFLIGVFCAGQGYLQISLSTDLAS